MTMSKKAKSELLDSIIRLIEIDRETEAEQCCSDVCYLCRADLTAERRANTDGDTGWYHIKGNFATPCAASEIRERRYQESLSDDRPREIMFKVGDQVYNKAQLAEATGIVVEEQTGKAD